MGLKKEIKNVMTNNMSIDTLKGKLLLDSNKELLDALFTAILDDINSIDKQSCSNDHEWIMTGLKYILEIIISDNSLNVNETIDKIKNIKTFLHVERSTPSSIKFLYQKILDTINPIIRILNKKAKIPEKDSELNSELYKFTCKLIFEIHNVDYVFQISKMYPELINCTDKEDQPIIYKLIKRQVKNIKLGAKVNKKLYFDRIINIIMTCNDFYLTDRQIHTILDYLKSELINIEEDNPELKIFADNTIKNLKAKSKITTTPKNIRELFKKYNISEIATDFLELEYNNHEKQGFQDYTDKKVITIDSSDNVRLFDDAISCEVLKNGNYLIGIYIADVASYIPDKSTLDVVAYNRAETIYLEDRVIDMLPLDLAYKCSLNTDCDKHVIAYMFEFTPIMELADFKVQRAVIKVAANLTFDKSQKLYKSNFKKENDIGVLLKDFVHFNDRFASSNFYNYDYHIFKEEIRKIENSNYHHNNNNDFSCLVASLMILVNRSMAKYFSDNDCPFLYRVNNSNIDKEVIAEIKESIQDKELPEELVKKIDKIYSRSRYASINTGHNGLGVEHYCHTTNPIRNYASLFTQRIIIEEFLNGGLDDHQKQALMQKIPRVAFYLNDKIDLDENFIQEYTKIHKKSFK